ncbi:MAG: fimbrillin family protein [Prevotella sp.]|nr:fimbrillin family protein [Prevotella sp.]
MKTKTLFYMALTAVMTTLAACSQDDELMDAAPKQAQIEFEITDGGYGGDEATRAVEDGFRTKFEANDECGLYIIDNGEFIAENVKLTAEEGENGITWKAADGAISGVTENSKYFLYYPYRENLDLDAQLGDDDTKVFDNFINPTSLGYWTWSDQTAYGYYSGSDLMTAKGTASTGADGKLKVSFSMTHRMALAVIEVPKTVYKFTGTSIPDYTVASSVDFSGSDYKPLRMDDGTYRFVFNSTQPFFPITGTINGKKFTISADKLKEVAKGTYKTFRIGGANATIEKEHTLQVGDYLMKDGSLVGKDALTEDDRGNVAAVVFSAGHNLYDKSDYSETGIGSKECHGYAVAVMDAAQCMWGSTFKKFVDIVEDQWSWSGYAYTQTIIKEAGDNLSNDNEGCPAVYYAVKHGTTPPADQQAPACSSGWFLPAIGQMNEICTQRETLFQNFGAALSSTEHDCYYWSSSESSETYVETVCISKDNGEIKISNSSKNNFFHVRAVLAF